MGTITEYCQNDPLHINNDQNGSLQVNINYQNEDHNYHCQKCLPTILNLKEKVMELEKICSDQKSELGTCRRKLKMSEIHISKLKSKIEILEKENLDSNMNNIPCKNDPTYESLEFNAHFNTPEKEALKMRMKEKSPETALTIDENLGSNTHINSSEKESLKMRMKEKSLETDLKSRKLSDENLGSTAHINSSEKEALTMRMKEKSLETDLKSRLSDENFGSTAHINSSEKQAQFLLRKFCQD